MSRVCLPIEPVDPIMLRNFTFYFRVAILNSLELSILEFSIFEFRTLEFCILEFGIFRIWAAEMAVVRI